MISLIAPVYNVEKYLPKFLESVLCQTFREFELLLVTDCPTDSSLEICEEYARKDHRIRVIAQPYNEGAAKARNRGLSEAKGEYIMFADSDDYLAADALEVSLNLLEKENVDIAYGGFYIDRDGEVSQKKFRGAKKVYSHDGAIKAHLNVHTLYGYPFGKLFKREVLLDVRYPEDMSCGEDGVFSFWALSKAYRVAFTRHPIYYYRIRSDSLSGRGHSFAGRELDVFRQVEYVREILEDSKFVKYLDVFAFMLFLGPMDKYISSDEEAKRQFQDAYLKMKTYCDKVWKGVMFLSINPRVKIVAMKYGLKKRQYDIKRKRN